MEIYLYVLNRSQIMDMSGNVFYVGRKKKDRNVPCSMFIWKITKEQ